MSQAASRALADHRPVLVAVYMLGPTGSLVRAGFALLLRRRRLTCRMPQGVGNDVGLHLVDALLARSVSARPHAPLHEPPGDVCKRAGLSCSATFWLPGALLTSVRGPAALIRYQREYWCRRWNRQLLRSRAHPLSPRPGLTRGQSCLMCGRSSLPADQSWPPRCWPRTCMCLTVCVAPCVRRTGIATTSRSSCWADGASGGRPVQV